MEDDKIRVGVIGASGYSGIECLRLLAEHPHVELTYVAGNHEEQCSLASTFPFLYKLHNLRIEKYDAARCACACDMVFVALPSGISGQIAVEQWKLGKRVIDLSGDLRLPRDLYELWYKRPSLGDDVVQSAVYGLTEWARENIAGADLVANPGCYATAILLALLPLVKSGLASSQSPLIIDAKSGVSGAGRHAATGNMLAELQDNFYPYKVGVHQHIPEIAMQLNRRDPASIVLTTQLLPAIRGIYATCYVPLSQTTTADDVLACFQDYYAHEPFIGLHGLGTVPELKHVRGSNRCHIGFHINEAAGLVTVFSALDNLQKGAAGQAIQNFNVMYGFDESLGLHRGPMYP